MCRHGSWSKSATALLMAEALEAKRWFSTGRVQWAIRHSTDGVTGNQQNVWSSQNEVRRRFVGPSSPRVVDANRKSTLASVIGDWSTSIRINSLESGSRWWRTVRWSTSLRYADGQSCQETKDNELWEPLPHTDNSYLQSSHFDIKV